MRQIGSCRTFYWRIYSDAGRIWKWGKKVAYNINEELVHIAKIIPYNPFVIKVANIYLSLADKRKKIPNDFVTKKFAVSGYLNRPVPVEVIEPVNNNEILPVMIYIHGGAFSYHAAPYHKELAYQYAKEIPCRVIFPDYHLSPRYTYPTAFLDNLSVYKWMMHNTSKLKIDENHIIVAGDSAGAAIAACLVNSYEKEQLVPPCGQMLIYPVTDASLSSESMKIYGDTPLWNAVNNQKMWKYYLNGKNEQERIKASPLDNELPDKVPETYIETAEYDCLHDEGIAYANKLKSIGTNVILNETYGTFHGYDSCLDAKISRTNIKKRMEFLKNLIKER